MIDWFEAKASEFKAIAKFLRETFNSQGQPIIQSTPENEPTAERVKAVLQKLGNARHSRIAEKLNADPEVVRRILVSDRELFEMIGRGWWKVKQ